ncbi:hypothetical protein [Ottowia thiooxydans]|uniref:hypothetical protein n=1 Tax=Ottowia thiooxydans TaxID=219182 RepID=UPI000421B61C|nr:hypothetical protein [Ottowia thiooxydans]
MKRRNALQSFGLLAVPGLLAACGPGDNLTPTPPPPAPSPADSWAPGVLKNASTFGSGTPALALQANGAGKMLLAVGPTSESLVFSVSTLDGSSVTMQRPGGTTTTVATLAPVADMRGNTLWLWQDAGSSAAQQLFYAVSSGVNGQISAARALPLSPAPSLQASVMAQDADGNALVRWSSGPLDGAGLPTLGGLLRFTAATQLWSVVPLPEPTANPALLLSANAVFDSNGRAWLIQPTPGTVSGEWTLPLYSLLPNAANWLTAPVVPATLPRSSIFQLSIDSRNRLVAAHCVAHDPKVITPPLSISRYDQAGAGWTTLPVPTLPSNGYRVSVDAVGNIWAVGASTIARYDNAAANWTGPQNIDFAPADGLQSDGSWPFALATNSQGNTWAVGVRRKTAGQDLPVLWINFFDATTRLWSQAGTLAVQGGENSSFVQPAQGQGTSFLVALALDSQSRPMATLTEILRTTLLNYQGRTWIARGRTA